MLWRRLPQGQYLNGLVILGGKEQPFAFEVYREMAKSPEKPGNG